MPDNINRSFIENALKEAIKIIGKDFEIQKALRNESLEIDKDTKDIPGTPPIADVILNKISNCGIFVPDLTFVGSSKSGRLIANPNVLIEYGWALREVTHKKIIPVMNTVFGKPDGNMPFDMRHLKHPITYHLEENTNEQIRQDIKNELVRELTISIKLIIAQGLLDISKNFLETPSTTSPSIFLQHKEELFTTDADKKMFLPDVERLFLRIIPTRPIELIKTSKEAYAFARAGKLLPMFHDSIDTNYERNKFGSIAYTTFNNEICRVTQLFKNGEIWGIDNYSIAKKILATYPKTQYENYGYFASVLLENVFVATLSNYINFASKTLRFDLPLKFIAGATNVKGYKMTVDYGSGPLAGKVVNDNIIYDGKIDDYNKSLLKFFVLFLIMCGMNAV